ncbi:hypothetical protein G4B88_015845 [Cannabis sativa]|uniref:non-specific serine/threonine protein kinase n=1 Tax=Cannabis sativa TaxID=3483 RepID=A0A7J6EQ54_CANSA|nr:hypothetical protein G4B88_015845 [Cannabis sativa]
MLSLLNSFDLCIRSCKVQFVLAKFMGEICIFRGMESNLFSGTIPSELGKLVNLEYLNLNANNLTGEFPLALTNLTKFDSCFLIAVGLVVTTSQEGCLSLQLETTSELVRAINLFGFQKFMSYVYVELTLLHTTLNREMEASGFKGPIPSSISNLDKLTELRITDLNGESSDFLDLRNMTNILKDDEELDLSFNKLEGEVPNFENVMQLGKVQIDISYNNFTETSEPSSCRDTFNHFRSPSGQKNNSILNKCLAPCSKDHYSLHINCGGKQTTIGGIKYEGDEDLVGAAKFLYTTARISPLSLTYYARCLANGNYTVKLHFAEIVVTNNRSYYSFGRRIFDVYVQEKLELKDFNIEKEANGVDKEFIKVVKAVVSYKTLEIRFQWTGKGTRNIPKRGMYGSLISAISIESDFKPPKEKKDMKFIIIGVVLSFCLVFITIGIVWWKCYLRKRNQGMKVMKILSSILPNPISTEEDREN